jgi:hypothetical protein
MMNGENGKGRKSPFSVSPIEDAAEYYEASLRATVGDDSPVVNPFVGSYQVLLNAIIEAKAQAAVDCDG